MIDTAAPAQPTPVQKFLEWGDKLLDKLSGADKPRAAQVESSAAFAKIVAGTGGATRYRADLTRSAVMQLPMSLALVRVHPEFPLNPMFCARGMHRRDLYALLRGHKRQGAEDAPPYVRFTTTSLQPVLAGVVDQWLAEKLTEKLDDKRWHAPPALKRGSLKEWEGFVRSTAKAGA